ncbi:MAG: GNAT family protein [Candidatus Margulisiibacteriota bacterium]
MSIILEAPLKVRSFLRGVQRFAAGAKPLRTNGFTLRPLGLTDLQEYVRLFADRNEHPWLWHEIPENILQGIAVLADEQMGRITGTSFLFAIEKRKRVVGVIGFRHINPGDCCGELVVLLKREERGNGIFRDAVRAVADFGFFELGLNRVYFYVDPGDQSMLKKISKMQELGIPIVREGLLRQNERIRGVFVDDEVYSVLKEDWKRFTRIYDKSLS